MGDHDRRNMDPGLAKNCELCCGAKREGVKGQSGAKVVPVVVILRICSDTPPASIFERQRQAGTLLRDSDGLFAVARRVRPRSPLRKT